MSDREYGEVVITRARDYDRNPLLDSVRITRADPRVLISAELLDQARQGEIPCITVCGDVVTLADDYGQRFIYRISPEPRADNGFRGACYEMEWPD